MNASALTDGPHAGWRLALLSAIDSTNEEARRRALAGDLGRLWVVAEAQTAGRGRHGRTWASPKGNLYGSALLIDPCPPTIAPQLGFVAGVALARAAEDVGAAGARLKWPNDLVCRGAKCAGILIEGASLSDRRLVCIVGFGVNCLAAPEGVGYPTAVLTTPAGSPIEPRILLDRLLDRFDETLGVWRSGEGFATIRSDWLERAAGLGGRVRIESSNGRREGTFEGLDAAGRLLFRGETGIEAVDAADLWILPASDGSPVAASSASFAREGAPTE